MTLATVLILALAVLPVLRVVTELIASEKQVSIVEATKSGRWKIVCVCSGRQAGKSYSAAIFHRDMLLTAPHGSIGWLVAPTIALTNVMLRRVLSVLSASGIPRGDVKVSRSNMAPSITYVPTGTVLELKTASRQGYLVGETLAWLHIDEAGRILDPRIFYEDLLPATSVLNAPILITGTPKLGAKWYRDLFHSGLEGHRQHGSSGFDIRSFVMDARDNPAGGELVEDFYRYERMTQEGKYPEATFRQEWKGEWVDMSGALFQHLDEAIALLELLEADGTLAEVRHKNIVCLDVGTSYDYAVATVFADRLIYDSNSGARVVVCKHVEQIPHMDHVRLGERLQKICEAWGERGRPARAIIDGTGLRRSTRRQLSGKSLRVHWHIWDEDNRGDAIEFTQEQLNRGTLAIPADDGLIEEMVGFTEVELPSGRKKWEAGPGLHDDRVMALIMGVYYRVARWRPLRFRSDEWADRDEEVSGRLDHRPAVDKAIRGRVQTRVKIGDEMAKEMDRIRRRGGRPGRTGGFFDG